MMFRTFPLTALGLAVAVPAQAQSDPTAPPKPVTVNGAAVIVSDYRYRGITRSDEKPVPQATVTVTHRSGVYVGAWASAIDGGRDGSTRGIAGYGDAEVDLYGGYAHTGAGGLAVDAGLQYYWFPGHADGRATDFFEPYASLGYTLGPAAAKLGANYAWRGQNALGDDDNLYVYGELSGSIPATPLTLKAHVGHSDGALGRVNPAVDDDSYTDWSLGAEATLRGRFKLGLTYVDTDIANTRGLYARGFGDSFRQRTAGFAQFYGRGATLVGHVALVF